MDINVSQQTFGVILIVVAIVVLVGGIFSWKKYGRMKIGYIVLFVVALGLGIKFALSTPTEKPAIETKPISFPKPNH